MLVSRRSAICSVAQYYLISIRKTVKGTGNGGLAGQAFRTQIQRPSIAYNPEFLTSNALKIT
jgi:hypothetical protein